jgi:hypothetical protein
VAIISAGDNRCRSRYRQCDLRCRGSSAWRDIMKTLFAAFTLAILFGSPALVQLANAAPPMDDARIKALQECGAMEKKYTQETWGVQQLDMYRACMAQRGQEE